MKVSFTVKGLVEALTAEQRAGERAVSSGVAAVGVSLKNAWRAQITGAGLGDRPARTIRSEVYPKGRPSLNAAALVWSKAPEIVGAHEQGALIRARRGLFLAIPTEAAGKGRGGERITPADWERRTGLRLIFVPRRTGPSLLIAEGRLNTRGRAFGGLTRPHRGHGPASPSRSKTGRGLTSVPVFVLVPQVRLKKRLNLARDAEQVASRLPGRIVANWVDGKG